MGPYVEDVLRSLYPGKLPYEVNTDWLEDLYNLDINTPLDRYLYLKGRRGYANGGLVQKFADGGQAYTMPRRGLLGKLTFLSQYQSDQDSDTNGSSNSTDSASTSDSGAGGTSTGVGSGPANPSVDSTNLSNALRKWVPANKLSFYPGWNTWGGGTLPAGIMMHHTSGVGPGVLEWMARNGRVEEGAAPGPVVQSMVSRDGTAHILANGVSLGWGAGEGSTAAFAKSYPGLAADIAAMGGASMSLWQIEVESAGLSQDFTNSQFDTIARVSAALKDLTGWPSFTGKIINHKDWAPGRKPDTLYDKAIFTANANKMWGGYAAGGFISGPGGPRSDMIPAMLSNGEYVVKASSVAKYGKGFMDKINSGSMNPFEGMSSMEPRMFANGGIVGSSPMPAFNMPEMSDASVGVTNTNYGGSSSSTNNSTKVNVVINGSGGKSANAIANKVISMINSANNRRNHSRSI